MTFLGHRSLERGSESIYICSIPAITNLTITLMWSEPSSSELGISTSVVLAEADSYEKVMIEVP